MAYAVQIDQMLFTEKGRMQSQVIRRSLAEVGNGMAGGPFGLKARETLI